MQSTLELVVLQVDSPKDAQNEETKKQDLKTVLASVEPFYSNLWSIFRKNKVKNIFKTRTEPVVSFEIISHKEELSFFFTVRKEFKNYLIKQIYSVYPDCKVTEREDDHNIFSGGGVVECAEMKLEKESLLPLKTYKNLEYDPLNSLTTAISGMKGIDGAFVQLIFKPVDNQMWRSSARETIKKIQKGEYEESNTVVDKFMKSTFGFFGELVNSAKLTDTDGSAEQEKKQRETEEKQEKQRLTPLDEERIKAISEKSSKFGFSSAVRFAIISDNEIDAKSKLENIEGIFAQFAHPEFNRLKKTKETSFRLISDMVMRNHNLNNTSILNSEELATMFHLPNKFITTPDIKWLPSKGAIPPLGMDPGGTLIGKSIFRGQEKDITIGLEDRFRHVYVIGQTGTGKSTLLKQMMVSDIKAGYGITYLDPHGEDVQDILTYIPKERIDDVIYFDPADIDYPMGLNIFEWSTEQEKDHNVQEFLAILGKLFDSQSMGPMFEHWTRNGLIALMEDESSEEPRTLVEMPRLIADDAFQDQVSKSIKNFLVKQFWTVEVKKTSGNMKGELIPWVLSKFGRFISSPLMRNIIGQSRSAFDFEEVMDEGKILLCNLNKGRLGEFSMSLVGMIVVAKLLAGAFKRVSKPKPWKPHFLYVDEFQNFASDSFSAILSEARKYRLSLTIAHQYTKQIDEKILSAVFGNVGSILAMRVGVEDAEKIAELFPGYFDKNDVANLPNRSVFAKLMVGGTQSKPFSFGTIPIQADSSEQLGELIKQMSKLKYGVDRQTIEREIEERVGKIG